MAKIGGGLSVPAPKTAMDRMAQDYRTRQARIAARSALKVGQRWKGVEVGNEQSEANFVELAVNDLAEGFMETSEGSADFVRETLGVEPQMPMFNREQAAASMAFVGPVQARRAHQRRAYSPTEDFARPTWDTEAFTAADARKHVQKQVLGSAVRLSAQGGREVVRSSVDGRRVGYVRVTSGDPCAFCAMLASRRAVYEEDSFDESDARFVGWGRVKVHDSCSCALVAVTRMNQDQLTQMNYFEQLWKDLSGLDPRETDSSPAVTFRRNYEAMRAA